MVGITLTPERIRAAPPAMRRWLEQEISGMLGFTSAPFTPVQAPPHLVACEEAEAASILAAIEDSPPVTAVYFELGRGSQTTEELCVRRLEDLRHHARLGSLDQVLRRCLEVIDAALQRLRGDSGATFYGLDPTGYCFIAAKTQRSIAVLWQRLIEGRPQAAVAPAAEAPVMPTFVGFPPSSPSPVEKGIESTA